MTTPRPPSSVAERRFRADRGDHGQRLDLVVVRHLADVPVSRSRVAGWIADGMVVVAGALARRPAQRVCAGDDVVVAAVPQAPPNEPIEAEPMELAIVWEDDHLLVVDKPAGVVVHPTRGRRTGTVLNGLMSLANGWPDSSQRPRTVHRLDQYTSGLLVVAKTAAAQAGLARAFQRRLVDKQYLAVTTGWPRAESGRIDTPIGRDPNHRRRRLVDGLDARAASTSWRVLARSSPAGSEAAGAQLLVCSPHTGRTHQIRVHLASIGLPLVGDELYRPPDCTTFPAEINTFPRQALHAWRLSLRHPVLGTPLSLVAEVPEDLKGLMEVLGLAVDH